MTPRETLIVLAGLAALYLALCILSRPRRRPRCNGTGSSDRSGYWAGGEAGDGGDGGGD